jgi:hypothetical protein
MKRKEIKRWMPVSVFAVVLSTIIHDVGTTLGFWTTTESIYPFHQMFPYYFGFMPVLTIWVFKFTYGHFGKYFLTNLFLDIGFNFFLLSYFLPIRGIMDFIISPILSLPITLVHAVVIYGYQYWQDEVLLRTASESSFNLQPAMAKPITDDKDDSLRKD